MGEVSQFLGEGLLIFGVMPHDNTVNERDIGYIELTYHFICLLYTSDAADD